MLGKNNGRRLSLLLAAIFIAGPLLMAFMPGSHVTAQRPTGVLDTTAEGWRSVDLAYSYRDQPLAMNLSISKYWNIQNASVGVSGDYFITDPGTQWEKANYPERPRLNVGGYGDNWVWYGVLGQQTTFQTGDRFVELAFDKQSVRQLKVPIPAGAKIENISFVVKNNQVGRYDYTLNIGNSDKAAWTRSDTAFSKGPHISTIDRSTMGNISISSVCVENVDYPFDYTRDIVGAGNNGEVFVVKHNGSLKYGFDLNPGPIIIGQGSPRASILDCALGDYDQDPGVDLALSTADGKMYALHNDGLGNFRTPGQVLSANISRVDSVAIGDVNGDEWGDLVGGYLDGQFWVSTYNPGLARFNSPYVIRAGTGSINGITVADIENDGRYDIIGASENRHWYILKNNGTALNMTIPVSCGTASLTSLAVRDLNWDNFQDLVSGSIDGSVYVAYNLGEGRFSDSQKLIGGSETMKDVVTEDVNLDGFPDILGLNGDGWVYIYSNNNGNLEEGKPILHVGAEQATIATGDLNNDNAPDIVVGGKNGMDIYWHTLMFQNETVGKSDGGLLKSEVQRYLDSYKPRASDYDQYGNLVVNVPFNITSAYPGSLGIDYLNVTYSFMRTVDIRTAVEAYVISNRNKADHEGFVNVPIQFMTDSPGRLVISDINIRYDIGLGAIIDSPAQNSSFNMSDQVWLRGHSNLDLNCSLPGFQYTWMVDEKLVGTGCQFRVNAYGKIGGVGDHKVRLLVQRLANQDIAFAEVDVKVLPPTPPNVHVEPVVKVRSGKEISIKVQATDSDPRDQANLTYGLWSAPQGMTINRTSGEINWTPGKDDVGSHMVVVNVSDGKNTTMATFNIKVERAATPVAVNQCFGWPAIFTIVIVGLAFGVVFVETEVGIFALYSLAFLLYTRLKQEMVLDNFVRGQIYGHICENPGLHLAEIQRKLKISAGTLIYHLKTLEREGLVKSFPNGSLRVFFSSSVKVPKELMSLTKAQRWILKAIEERPGISQKELSESTGLSDSTVNRIVHELEERGMVRIEKGKTTQCFIVDN